MRGARRRARSRCRAPGKEVDAIASILRGDQYSVDMLTGTAASERALRKDMEQATVAHLATHGAYRDEKEGGVGAVNALWQSQVVLSQSGNQQSMKRDDDDGRLYGMELMMWDLSDLDLLVLSACETARGQETFVGGLRGLPTAINIAGAKRSLLTLWPVDDAGTAAFMVGFYDRLAAGQTYPEALRQTRRDARDGKICRRAGPAGVGRLRHVRKLRRRKRSRFAIDPFRRIGLEEADWPRSFGGSSSKDTTLSPAGIACRRCG